MAQGCEIEILILGAGQDAGIPQIGHSDDPGWTNPKLNAFSSSLALVDHRSDQRYLFDATPDIRAQLAWLDRAAPPNESPLGLDGVFLTHAHIGHYTGLMFAGRESAGTQGLKVYAMPRMKNFLETNGPWSQLVELGNIDITALENGNPIELADNLTVTALQVPHRDEYSETVGYYILAGEQSALYIPDIDQWDNWTTVFNVGIVQLTKQAKFSFLDATFYDDNELPGRDMSEIPHPRVVETMQVLDRLDAKERARVNFIHYNHTNPIRDPDSPQTQHVLNAGFGIARDRQRFCLQFDDTD